MATSPLSKWDKMLLFYPVIILCNQSYLWQNYFFKSLAKGRRLTNRCTLQQKHPYFFFLHLCLSFIPLAPSNLNSEPDTTIVLQLVSAPFSMLNPSYRPWNMSSFYDHLLKLIQKSDNSNPELPQWPKYFLMTFFLLFHNGVVLLQSFLLHEHFHYLSSDLVFLLSEHHDPMSKEFSHFVWR